MQMSALLRYHYGLAVDKKPDAERIRLFAELKWVRQEEKGATITPNEQDAKGR